MKLISFVVPVWNDESAMEIFANKMICLLNGIEYDYEIIFCVDPYPDNTKEKILNLFEKNNKIKAIFFSKRIGQSASTMAGLANSKGSAVIIMDVDLQDPIELIPKMLTLWEEGNNHVLPQRISRSGEPITKRITATLGYLFLKIFSKTHIPMNTGDFRLLDRKLVNHLISFKEFNIFIRGLVSYIDENPRLLPFQRPPRKVGKTKYNKWFGSIRSGINGLIGNSKILLDIIVYSGFILAFGSFLLGLRTLWWKLTGVYIPEGGTQLLVVVTFVGGMNLIGMGFVGLYVSRIFDEVRLRPRWLIQEAIGIEMSSSSDQ
jgi:glycosyltransferase involved in cell wall biosynthesis